MDFNYLKQLYIDMLTFKMIYFVDTDNKLKFTLNLRTIVSVNDGQINQHFINRRGNGLKRIKRHLFCFFKTRYEIFY